MRRILAGAVLLLTLSVPVVVTAQPRLELTIDTIMRGQGLAGYPQNAVRWSPDGQQVFFSWKQYTDPIEENSDTYVVGRDGKGLRKLTDEEAKHAPPANGNYSRDRKRAVYTSAGDVFLYDVAVKQRRALTDTTDTESSAHFTRDEQHVAFVRGGNLFVLSLKDGAIEQKTNIVASDARGPHVTLFDDENKNRTESQKWVAEEAKKLSDVLARRAAEKKEEDEKRKNEIAIAPMKLKSGEEVSDLRLSPDEKYVIAFISVEGEKAKRPIVPSYVTDTGYTTDLPARLKVGDSQQASRVASISTTDGKVQWLKHGLKVVEPVNEAVKEATAVTQEQKVEATAEKTETKEAADRDLEMEELFWSDDGTKAVLPVRAADNKDSWLLALDPATANARVIAHEHDPAWVHWLSEGSAGFVPNTGTVWFISERTGWLHLYTIPYDGGEPRAITSGEWEVDDVTADIGDRKSFYLTTSKDSLFERHLYRVPVTGGALTKLTTATGWHNATPSPDGTSYADVYSYTNKPAELYINTTRVTTSPAPEFANYPWLDVPIVHFKARDGKSVPGRLYMPENWNGGPAVIFVHGAGYLQNVHRGWSNYFREYMFHHLLRERGYVVLDIDYRASSGYGRDWRTAIYRHMGGVDLNDHVDAAKWLASEHKVDPKRIGIYGGSYGGFITLMAMFTTPDVFAAGAALRPVTDWAHYNHPYTANILNTPQKDPEAYRRSSPIYFAEGLKGALLMCHGVIDVNVHFQDTVRLAQRLIELRKENWEVAMYPLEDHSFVEPTSWADEYKRVLKLFESELK
ncbi:MAG TPA: alpha/beta fold hydrolase [Thermoanaerobaculia bacterium]|jgi:dipeptidyl aminopeptidase/acylaminoacyl peptidase|nr:alpha/beta fold hydrolase [Thermoanaerobaculia bacterium]